MTMTWSDLRGQLARTLTLDDEWTIDGPDRLDWWGWLFPQRIELTERIDRTGEDFVLGTIRISTGIGTVRPGHEADVIAALTEWNQDAPGAIGIIDEQDVVRAVWGVPLRPGGDGITTRMAVSAVPRQSAYAARLAGLLEGRGLIQTGMMVHPSGQLREEPDDLVKMYASRCLDPSSLAAYRRPEVMAALRRQMEEHGMSVGFESSEQGIVTFQLDDGYTFVGMQFGGTDPNALVDSGEALRIRCGIGDARALGPGRDTEAMATAARTNRLVWQQPRTTMLAAWSGAPNPTDLGMLGLVAIIAATGLQMAPGTSPEVLASVLRDQLITVLHQGLSTAAMTYSE
jgi:hypothetical protein